jgi:hypothetical protein
MIERERASREKEAFPRDLTEREREILDFLLSVDFPGCRELRAQARTARVTGRLVPGEASIWLGIDPELPAASAPLPSWLIEAEFLASNDFPYGGFLVLGQERGRLSDIELAVFVDDAPVEFPPPSAFGPPNPQRPV